MSVTDITQRYGGPAPAAAPTRPTERIPPHSLSAEESLLGAMLLSRDAIADVLEIVRAEHFYRQAHVDVFEAVHQLYSAGEPADAVTVAENLERNGKLDTIGGLDGLLGLQMNTPAISNAVFYARIVQENHTLRRLIEVAGEIAELGYSRPDDVTKAVDSAENMMYQVAQGQVGDNTAQLSELLDSTLDRLEELYERGDALTGTATGYTDLDRLLSGLQASSLYVVGARPSMGKTSFALGMAAHAAIHERRPVLVFSLEMGHMELTQRMLCSEARIDSSKMRDGNLSDQDWSAITAAMGRLADAPMWIDDNPNVTVMEIRARARRLKSQVGDLAMVVVDYLQLMTGRNSADNRQVEVAEISRGLKILARELDCPVVALSQLSRNLEMRQNKRPILADLRESGAIEQDADVVMFIYRDEVYTPDDTATMGLAEVIVAKNRNGPTATTELSFLSRFTKFANLSKSGL
ncbi:MAG: replicative DNA helicase [Acidimicrobiaceae bacterium]|nr:replicative DNA helicase [Acidimicrobiaceae bacterium]MCY4176856.1 replicative DNA helicase [Acidimicrobiaceae bacterium]MCY4279611.1 replicative DNA helicase [Acidimicrobiaceae bacterium]MCY4293981.1 replicative DNA helicase [Acidimicrobiaceae bacterium]